VVDSTRPRWVVPIAIVVVVGLVAILGGGWWLKRQIDPPGGPGATIEVIVPEGTSTSGVAEILASKDVVENGTIFKLYLKAKSAGPFQAGTYRLRTHLAMSAAADALERGPALPAAVNITIAEGLVLEQIASRVHRRDPRLSAEAFLSLVKSGQVRSRYSPVGQASLEGLLFPDTYRVEQNDNERTLVEQMVGTFDSTAQGLGYDQAQQLTGFSAYQVVIVASLVEAEAKSDADRAKIARVIYNRLAKGMPLGIDAAFYYTLPLDRRGTALRQSDLARDTPYNTRLHAGLVPTPIMAPGRPSLEAALHPADGSWLYYVLQDARTHAFSTDYQQFLRDKAAAERKGLIP
jgi:UPF0755 protein